MKIATYQWGGERQVGQLSADGKQLAPLDLGLEDERDGALALIKAEEHVWGYTITNDVTTRALQVKYKQWLMSKSLDTFGPMGPWLVRNSFQ